MTKKTKKKRYTGPVLKSCDEQTACWVAGQSYHSDHRGLGEECCPDFSCCRPELLQPLAVRQAFAAGDARLRDSLCMQFLGEMLAKISDKKVHITGGDPPEQN